MNSETSKPSTSWNKHRTKLILFGLFIISFVVQLLINDSDLTSGIGSATAQLITSWLLSYVAVQFANKYYNFSVTTWWIRIYALMIVMNLFAFLLFPDEMSNMTRN